MKSVLLVGCLFLSLYLSPVEAASRCGRKLINLDTLLADVISVCGQPAAHASQAPALRANGVPRKGSAKTDVLVYGPSGGAWQYMLFRNEMLIRVDMRRKAPEGNLLKW